MDDEGSRPGELGWIVWAASVAILWLGAHWPPLTADALLPAGIPEALQARAFREAGPVPWLIPLALVALGATLVGARILAALGQTSPTTRAEAAEHLAHALACGLGALATAFGVAGLAGHFHAGVLTALAVVLPLLAAPSTISVVVRCLRLLATGHSRDRFLMFLTAGAMALALAKSLIPPWYPDALFYHLALPRLYLDAGAIVPVPSEPINSGHPALAQMLFALPMSWGREDLCAVLSLVLHAAGLLAAALLARPFAAVALATLATLPHLAFVSTTPLADSALFAYLALALLATTRALATDSDAHARAASLALGFALASKYQALLPVGLLALALLAGFARRRGMSGALRLAAPCALLALLPWTPWLVRNALHFQNPLYPLVLTASTPAPVRTLMALFRADWLSHGHRTSLPFLPVDLTFFASPDDLAAYEGEIGPLPLLLAPLALLALAPGPRRAPVAWALAAYALALFLAWAAGGREVRYLFPAFPPYVALCCSGLASAPFPVASAKRAVALGALLAAVWLAGYARPGADLLYLAGGESRADYWGSLAATRPLHLACEALSRVRARRALFFWEDRGFYCRVPYLADHLVPASSNHVLHALPEDPAGLARRLTVLGVTHVVVNRQAADEALAAGTAWPFGDVLARHLTASAAPLPGFGPADRAAIEVWALR